MRGSQQSEPYHHLPQLDFHHSYYEQEDNSSSFAPDITPVVLAAQCNNFDIVHMLIQKGFTIATPAQLLLFLYGVLQPQELWQVFLLSCPVAMGPVSEMSRFSLLKFMKSWVRDIEI